MSMSDPVADMLTRIRNAQQVNKSCIIMPSSNLISAIANVLKQEGYINNFNIKDIKSKPAIEIFLKYYAGNPVIKHISRVSRPGLRLYKGFRELPKIMNGLGIAIISTSYGVMSDKKARFRGIGGEVLCYIA